MFRWKSKKNKLILYLNESTNIDVDDIIIPAKLELPQWWKKLKPFNSKLISSSNPPTPNVKQCPSFHELFSNSYLLKAPTDLIIETNKDGLKSLSPTPFFRAEFHSPSQIKGWNSNKQNIKFELNFPIKLTNKTHKFIYLSPTYYNNFPFEVIPGVLKLIPNTILNFAVNTMFNIDKNNLNNKFFIEKGTILCMLYCPEGLVDIEVKDQVKNQYPTKFVGWYLDKVKKYKK